MIYMAVTADEFELPLCVETSVGKIAEYAGMRANTVSSCISKQCSGTTRKIKFVKVEEEEIMLTEQQKEEINNYIMEGKELKEINLIMGIPGKTVTRYFYYSRRRAHMAKRNEMQGNIIQSLCIGDEFCVKEEKGKNSHRYKIESIPSHKRFVVCRKILNDTLTSYKVTFSKHDLTTLLVEFNNSVKKESREEVKQDERRIYKNTP